MLSLGVNGSAIVVFSESDKQPFASKVTHGGEVILDTETGWFKVYEEGNVPEFIWKNTDFFASVSGEYIFHQKGKVNKKIVSVEETLLQKNWKLSFSEGWDTPSNIDVSELKSLTGFKDEAIKHYSGTITYSKVIDIDQVGKHVILDLGSVANIAELWCNGNKVGVRWSPPFSFDISKHIKEGKNTIEIKVTNTWRNQLIFDNRRPKDTKKTWTTNPPKKHDTKLEPSGLIGPVILKFVS